MVCAMIEKRRIICGQERDGDEGIREKKERKTEPEVLLVGERESCQGRKLARPS